MKRNMAFRFLGALLVLVGLVLFQEAVHASDAIRGTWTAEWRLDRDKDDDAAKPAKYELQLNMSRGGRKNYNMGQGYDLSAFQGLTEQQVKGAKNDVHFQLVRDAGTIAFEGFFSSGMGAGQFTFTPSADYAAKMQNLGFECRDEKQFEMAALDVSLAYAREFRELGLSRECQKLIEGRIFNVNRQQVEELKALGYTNLPLSKLVELRIFHVDAAYIRQQRAAGVESLQKMIESRIFNITPEFRKQFADMGYTNLTQEQLTAFKIHGVTPEFIREMRALGFTDLSPDKLQEFRIFGVGARQIEDLKAVGYTGLSADQLVAFKIHGVDSEFIKKVKKYGYAHPSPDRLVEMKILGIRVHDNDKDNDRDDDERDPI
ncbi:MAG TPA: hypothetical protein VLA96_03500 [Terriglobales bacterium]|jgi:hypothetical protein|nr:hypothetical protein [Terriglobales bacterium]